MIKNVSSSLESFRAITFEPFFNIVLADRTLEATKKDTRNGIGKSTLIDIINFCLGAGFTKEHRLAHPLLNDVSFTLALQLRGNDITVTRSTADASRLWIQGTLDALPLPKGSNGRTRQISLKEWTSFLGQYWFGIPTDSPRKYAPTFRSVISFFTRAGKEAFFSPFRHFRVQSTWDMQVNNAFLLGLAWEDASDLELLRDKRKALSALKLAAEDGFLGNVWGSRPQLEVDKVRLEETVKKTRKELDSFQILSQYHEVEERANTLSRRTQELSDENATELRILQMYERSMQEEVEAQTVNIEDVYRAASVELPNMVVRQLDEVREFHRTVVENRRQFLTAEATRLQRGIAAREEEIRKSSEEQAALLALLSSHGALDQYSKLQQAHYADVVSLNQIVHRLDLVKRVEENKATLKIESALLEQRARKDYDGRRKERESAISIFDGNSQALYKVPGRLLISVDETGFRFNVQIERKGSTGISNMEIFCYDLMMAERWASYAPNTMVLIHDSNIFADVDDRQIALALELAREKSEAFQFQYICTFNSDKLPTSEFSENFKIDSFTRMTLTDENPEGGLLGIRLPPTPARKD